MSTYRYIATVDAETPEEAGERIEEMIANEGVPAWAVVAHDPASDANAIMVELAGLVDGIDDGEDVDATLSEIARRIVVKLTGFEPPAVDKSTQLAWKVGDRFMWRGAYTPGIRVVLCVGETHLAFAPTSDPADWVACLIGELNDNTVDRLRGTADSIAVKHMLDAIQVEHGESLYSLLRSHPTYA